MPSISIEDKDIEQFGQALDTILDLVYEGQTEELPQEVLMATDVLNDFRRRLSS